MKTLLTLAILWASVALVGCAGDGVDGHKLYRIQDRNGNLLEYTTISPPRRPQFYRWDTEEWTHISSVPHTAEKVRHEAMICPLCTGESWNENKR